MGGSWCWTMVLPAGADLSRRLAELEAEKIVIDQDNAKLQRVLEPERGVLREVMATARKAVGEMNRQNEILKKRVAELEASQGSSTTVTVNHDDVFQKDLEIQRLQIKVHEQELELRKAKRGEGAGPGPEDYSGAGLLVTRIQRGCPVYCPRLTLWCRMRSADAELDAQGGAAPPC